MVPVPEEVREEEEVVPVEVPPPPEEVVERGPPPLPPEEVAEEVFPPGALPPISIPEEQIAEVTPEVRITSSFSFEKKKKNSQHLFIIVCYCC